MINSNMVTNKNACKIFQFILYLTFYIIRIIGIVLVTFVDIVFVTFFCPRFVKLIIALHTITNVIEIIADNYKC